ncbi:MAG: YCF48-related protein [Acidobacteriota bacterium]|nr:YCF48-related protein [Acidobacteriota bacterium]
MLRCLTPFLFVILFSAQPVSAQSDWRTSHVKGTGDLVAIYFTSAEKGWVAGDNGYLAFTQDGGKSWLKYPIKTTQNINEIYFRNNDNGYLVAGRNLFITDDGGVSWRETLIYRPNDFRNGTPEFLSIRFADKKRGLAIGSVLNKKGDAVIDSLVMRTQDGGETWRRVFVPSKTELFHVDFNGSSHGWIVGDKGLILATEDGGESWRVQSSGTDATLYNVDFRDDNEGYAVGGKGTILRTDNGGETWEKVATGFRDNFMRVDFADDKNGWIVGHGGSILRSSDKGKTWQRQEIAAKGNLYGLYMMKKYGWAVGAGGLIIQYQK